MTNNSIVLSALEWYIWVLEHPVVLYYVLNIEP